MPTLVPAAVSGARVPNGAKGLPANVRAAIRTLVWGVEDHEGRNPPSLAEAAKAGDMKADTLRRWLSRPEARAAVAAERAGYLNWAVSANVAVLSAIRDYGVNEAARVRAVALLEEMAGLRSSGAAVQVNVQTNVASGRIGYHYAECDRKPVSPPIIEAAPERIDERPIPNAMLAWRAREGRDRLEDEARAAAEQEAAMPIFRPGPGYFWP